MNVIKVIYKNSDADREWTLGLLSAPQSEQFNDLNTQHTQENRNKSVLIILYSSLTWEIIINDLYYMKTIKIQENR